MRLVNFHNIANVAFKYVIWNSKTLNIDESHALKHSMDVFNYANEIYYSELKTNPYLTDHYEIITASAILHDMCDKKYVDETIAVKNIECVLTDYLNVTEIETVSKIISTISYSKVKLNGYPDLQQYQLAYNIVREADLLSAYDINRCIIYGLMKENLSYTDSTKRAIQLFETRMGKYKSDNLFITECSKQKSTILEANAKNEIAILQKLIG
jgi:hypothetical protein